MKILFLCLLIVFLSDARRSIEAAGQRATVVANDWLSSYTTATVNYEGSEHFYVIEYSYDTMSASIPAIVGAIKLHYAARITVFVIRDGQKQQLGLPMDGTYVPGGCFEDIPAEWVRRAQE